MSRISPQTGEGTKVADIEDITDLRSVGTVYQNTTGGPIEIIWSMVVDPPGESFGGDNVDLRLFTGPDSSVSATTHRVGPRFPNTGDIEAAKISFSQIIPANSYYEVDLSNGSESNSEVHRKQIS